MLNPYKGGSKIQVGEYTFYLPPVGYVPDIENDNPEALIKVPILFAELPKKEQIWRREKYPKDYSKKRASEIRLQKDDSTYQDAELKAFRDRQWSRRYNGCWISIKGKPIYITGLWWMHLQWNRHDFGYPNFRWPEHYSFYTLQAAEEDPTAYGTIEVTIRRDGKTARLGSWILDAPTRTFNYNGGVQSKTSEDAEKAYQKAVMPVFKNWPDFFKPVHNQKRLLREVQLSPTLKIEDYETMEVDEKPKYIESRIDYRATKDNSYDGYKLGRMALEEPGKWVEASVEETIAKLKPTLTETSKKRRIIGKMFLPSTVNDENKGGRAFYQIWEGAKPIEGRSGTNGFYRIFKPADMCYEYDEYGFCDEKEANKKIMAEREKLKDFPIQLSEFIRQYPLTPEEGFLFGGDECHFNKHELSIATEFALTSKTRIRKGDFVWTDDTKKRVEFLDNEENGAWHVSLVLSDNESNKFVTNTYFNQTTYTPTNALKFRMGVDPVDHKKTIGKGSSIASAIWYMFDPSSGDDESANNKNERGRYDWVSNCFVADYLFRSPDPTTDYENIVKAALYYGCLILCENNKIGFINWCNENGYGPLLMTKPEALKTSKKQQSETEGATSNTKTINYYTGLLGSYVHWHIWRCPHIRIINDLMKFNPAKTTEYDMAVAAGYALMAAKEDRQIFKLPEQTTIISLFPTYKAM